MKIYESSYGPLKFFKLPERNVEEKKLTQNSGGIEMEYRAKVG